jgi:hypothetical protein
LEEYFYQDTVKNKLIANMENKEGNTASGTQPGDSNQAAPADN